MIVNLTSTLEVLNEENSVQHTKMLIWSTFVIHSARAPIVIVDRRSTLEVLTAENSVQHTRSLE